MLSNWLGQDWPKIYPIEYNSPRFQSIEKNWGNVVGDNSGVYILVALDTDKRGEERRIIPRLLSSDETGTLYIGKADRNNENGSGGLASRIGGLCNSILPDRKGTSHFNGKIRDFFANKLPASSLAVCWLYLDSRKYSYASYFEADLIRNYTRVFGEAPPFNSQGFIS